MILDYAAALIEQNRLFGEAVFAGDLSMPVPTCPGWTLVQLLRHVGRGDRWAAQIIRDRTGSDLDPRLVPDGRLPGGSAVGCTKPPSTAPTRLSRLGSHTNWPPS
jgi:hypothetical protein